MKQFIFILTILSIASLFGQTRSSYYHNKRYDNSYYDQGKYLESEELRVQPPTVDYQNDEDRYDEYDGEELEEEHYIRPNNNRGSYYDKQ